MSNTYKDFLKTAEPDTERSITCPSCGSPMGVRVGGYQMIATDSFRLELNTSIASLRAFLENLESLLEHRNQPLDPLENGIYPYQQERNFYSEANNLEGNNEEDDSIEDGFLSNNGRYIGVIGQEVNKRFVKEQLDFFQDIDKFGKFPLKDETNEELMYEKCMMLLRGIEPRSLSGPLSYLILDQTKIFTWRQNLSQNRKEANIKEKQEFLKPLLEEICPSIQWYLDKLMALHKNNPEDENVPGAVLRAQLLLAVLLGHKTDNPESFNLNNLEIHKNVQYSLPRLTIISYENLWRLLDSEVVLGNPQLRLSPQFRAKLKTGIDKANRLFSQRNTDAKNVQKLPDSQKTYKDEVQHMIHEWGEEINKLVYFSCKGSKGISKKSNSEPNQSQSSVSQPSKKTQDSSPDNDTKVGKCGWYPKETKTHSIILVGSRGTGKSSVMLTGLVAFNNYLYSIGGTLAFDLPKDTEEMQKLDKMYQSGEFFGATQLGDRNSINLSVKIPAIDSPENTHFSFTDVPGEVFERSLTREGSSSEVVKVLKNAETVVFFFDLLMESKIRNMLTKTRNSDTWKSVLEQFDIVNESRKKKASVSQFALLEKLLGELQDQRQKSDLQKMNFICVIPKSDIYANPENPKEKFFTEFYQEMERCKLVTKSEFDREDNGSFDSLCSLGGTGYKARDAQESKGTVNRVQTQKNIGRIISESARKCLLKIGNALGQEANELFKSALLNSIDVGLIQNLEETFGKNNVYFLPTSGQGKDNSKYVAENKTTESNTIVTGSIPNQKLSEYVFLLPAVLAIPEGDRE